MSADRRLRVLGLYKQLLYRGREYPLGYDYFRTRCRRAFDRNRQLAQPEDIDRAIAKGQYVVGELEAMWSLNKYRAMKKRYYDTND